MEENQVLKDKNNTIDEKQQKAPKEDKNEEDNRKLKKDYDKFKKSL